jgi:hypothetical protein
MSESRKRKLTERGESHKEDLEEQQHRSKRRLTAKHTRRQVDDLADLFSKSGLSSESPAAVPAPKSDDTSPPGYWYSGGRKDRRKRGKKTRKHRKH